MGSGPIPVATGDAGRAYRDLHRSGRWTKHNKRTKTKPQRHASPNQGRRHDVLPRNRQESLAVICANQGSPEEYGSRLQIQALRAATPVEAARLRSRAGPQIASPRAPAAALRIAAMLVL